MPWGIPLAIYFTYIVAISSALFEIVVFGELVPRFNAGLLEEWEKEREWIWNRMAIEYAKSIELKSIGCMQSKYNSNEIKWPNRKLDRTQTIKHRWGKYSNKKSNSLCIEKKSK